MGCGSVGGLVVMVVVLGSAGCGVMGMDGCTSKWSCTVGSVVSNDGGSESVVCSTKEVMMLSVIRGQHDNIYWAFHAQPG